MYFKYENLAEHPSLSQECSAAASDISPFCLGHLEAIM